MTSDELDRALRQLRMSGMAEAVPIRTQQARAENLGPLDFISLLVHDELHDGAIASSSGALRAPASGTREPSIRSTGSLTRSIER
jgi:hypothetical protein